MTVERYVFEDDGTIPNSRLPALRYRDVGAAAAPDACQATFAEHGWLGAWRDGIYPFHHFHSTAHEVLGVVRGQATVMLGGPRGERLQVATGDVLVLPAGTGHCRQQATDDFLVIGAYPDGMAWDIRRGEASEREEVLANLAAVPLPGSDPVHGAGGELPKLWTLAAGT